MSVQDEIAEELRELSRLAGDGSEEHPDDMAGILRDLSNRLHDLHNEMTNNNMKIETALYEALANQHGQ